MPLDFQGEQAAPKKPRGRAANIIAASKKQRQQQANQTALVILTIADGMVQTLLAPECKLTDDERNMIQPPLERMLERVDPMASAVIEKYTDPILLAVGLVMWGLRIWQTMASKMEASRQTPPNKLEKTEYPLSANGQVGSVNPSPAPSGSLSNSPLIETLAELGQ